MMKLLLLHVPLHVVVVVLLLSFLPLVLWLPMLLKLLLLKLPLLLALVLRLLQLLVLLTAETAVATLIVSTVAAHVACCSGSMLPEVLLLLPSLGLLLMVTRLREIQPLPLRRSRRFPLANRGGLVEHWHGARCHVMMVPVHVAG